MHGTTDEDIPADVTEDILRYAQIATRLGKPIAPATQSRRGLLRPLQHHAELAGILLARSYRPGALTGAEVERAALAALRFLEQAQPNGADEFYAATQLARAAPILARALLRAAAACGRNALERVVATFDQMFAAPNSRNGRRLDLRRELAIALYRVTGDTDAASARLQPLIELTREQTPEQQVEALAELATAFAAVGNEDGARAMLKRIHLETLGYARPARKDAQYDTWLELLKRSNAVDTERRGERVAFMMRQIAGMAETEGDGAARRLGPDVLVEAMLVGPATGLSAARSLVNHSLITWDSLVTALLRGLMVRTPGTAAVCASVWCSLALPFYAEPYYSSSKTGKFVETVIGATGETELGSVINLFRDAISAESVVGARARLATAVANAAGFRGVGGRHLREFVRRWQSENPPERSSNTPLAFDDVNSLPDLETAAANGEESSWVFARAFARLVPDANYQHAKRIFLDRQDVRSDAQARFALLDRAIAEGDTTFATDLVAGYRDHMDERGGWSSWTGAARRRWFGFRVRLEGPEIRREAFNDLATELAAGREYGQSLLWSLEEVFPLLAEVPDWPAMWDLQAEQLSHTREYALGAPFEASAEVYSDTDLIVALHRWALSLGAVELTRHVRVSAIRLARTIDGKGIATALTRALFRGSGDEPMEGIVILSQEPSLAVDDLIEELPALVDHPDYIVSVLAQRLSHRLGIELRPTATDLPGFYRIALDDAGASDFEAPQLANPDSGAMLVEDPLGWTFAMSDMIEPLAKNGISVSQIRRRCAMLIASWGGLEQFGQGAITRMQAELGRMEMRLPYGKPHIVAAMRALRYVAGELRRAGQVAARDDGLLLHLFDCPPVGIPLVSPTERPGWLPRASVGDNFLHEADTWLEQAASDIVPLYAGNDLLIASISRFERRDIRRTFKAETIRLPFAADFDGDSLDQWYARVPVAIWVDGVAPLDREPSPVFVRRLIVKSGITLPRRLLVPCPLWMQRLRWRRHAEDWMVLIDTFGQVVTRSIWWRDGGPTDVRDDAFWGEGMLILLTPEGKRQLESVNGTVALSAATRRTAKEQYADEPFRQRIVKS